MYSANVVSFFLSSDQRLNCPNLGRWVLGKMYTNFASVFRTNGLDALVISDLLSHDALPVVTTNCVF